MLIKDAAFAVVDCETTGLDPKTDRVVEMAMVLCDTEGINGKFVDELHSPGFPIPPSASAIHHIVDSDVEQCRPYDPARHILQQKESLWTYAAHNAAFDSAFLKLGEPFICTMRLAQKLWPDLESYSNQFLRYHLKLNPPVERGAAMHRALPDAIVTATLLVHELSEVIRRANDDGEPVMFVNELIEWIDQPMLLVTVRFGKHKGLKWSEVPLDYLRWIIRSMDDADIDTLHTAKHYLNA